jgi:hypothetical protein
MKKTILIVAIIATSLFATAQKDTSKPKQDTTVQVLLSLNDYKALLYVIDSNIDSKQLTKQLLELLQKNASIYQPADKPKQQPMPKKN